MPPHSFGCNPLLIWYSQEARSYSLLFLLATLSLLAFAYARCPEPAARYLWGWAIVASLTLATHYYAMVAAVPQAVWLLWVHRHDRRVLLTVAGVGAFGPALLLLAISQRPQASWIAQWSLDRRLGQIAPQYLLGTGTPAQTPLKLAGGVAVVVAVVMLAWRANGSERRGGLLAGGLAQLGFLIALLLVPAGVDELITRNVLVVLIPLIASGLGARRAGLVGLLGATILCVVASLRPAPWPLSGISNVRTGGSWLGPSAWSHTVLPGAPYCSRTPARSCPCRSTCQGCAS